MSQHPPKPDDRTLDDRKLDDRKLDDRKMDIIMGRILQAGVLLASLVVLVGGVLYARTHAGTSPDYHAFNGEPENLRQLTGVAHGVAAADPASIILMGLLLLIATPVARVAFAVVAFAVERDKLYVAVSLAVLAVLLFGFIHSR
jgi:uncharacterized membrane protein